jgi:1-deoxy-D-xylulose-5-phosphate reductoisomerase
MRLPIQLALAYPERMPEPAMGRLDLPRVGTLSFGTPDLERFPCLELAMRAGSLGGTYPAAMAAADEVAVERFLDGEIGFLEIPRIIEAVLADHANVADPDLETVIEADRSARERARRVTTGVTA